jgi:hypothetical protein
VGVPTSEAERMIPIRRHLFGSTPKTPHEPAVAVAEEAPPAVGTAKAEVVDTLARLRTESVTRVDALRTTIEHSGELKALTIAKRAERDRERAGRTANGRH